MTPGTVLFDPNYEYENETTGGKFIVILNDGDCGFYLDVKTTTQEHYKYKSPTTHCERYGRPPNFYLPKGLCDALIDDTWILLDKFREETRERTETRLKGVLEYRGLLKLELFIPLLDCAMASRYMDRDHRKMLMDWRVRAGVEMSKKK